MTDLQRALRKARQLITAARRELDQHGYRENLGYDQYPKLRDYLDTLDLPYVTKATILEEFATACDAL